MDMTLSARKLDKMIKKATVDCYDDLEQASGFFTMIEDHLAVPFATEVLGIEVSVVGVEMDDNGSLKPKIRDEILEDAAAFAGVGFSAHFRRHNRGQLLR